jgi:Ca2+-binding EF-hand superfamily protein
VSLWFGIQGISLAQSTASGRDKRSAQSAAELSSRHTGSGPSRPAIPATQAGLAEQLLGNLSPEHMKAVGAMLEQDWKGRPEWGDMAVAILKGEAMRPGMGWWRPTAKRYAWDWLRQRFDANQDGHVGRDELPESLPKLDLLFERLDRDLDDQLNAADFDYSDSLGMNLTAMQGMLVSRLFWQLDTDSNGAVTPAEVMELFARADKEDFGFLTPEDLRTALDDPESRRGSNRSGTGDEPAAADLLRMFFTGQLGSLEPGPELGELAPDFELPTHDGKRTFKLSNSFGKRPVLLIFGSFT